jgi:hypothetical protein
VGTVVLTQTLSQQLRQKTYSRKKQKLSSKILRPALAEAKSGLQLPMHFHPKLLALQVLQVLPVLPLVLPLVLLGVHPSARFPSTWL